MTEEHNKSHKSSQHQAVSQHHDDDLKKLKQEILQQVGGKNKRTLPWGSLTVTIVLVILTILSISQTVQSASILNKVEKGNFGAGASPAAADNVQSLPDMVGGC